MNSIQKILIANRGEIACRVIRSARKLGIQTVAIYSDIDRNAPHVILADEAYRIGNNPSNESYLKTDQIIELAKQKKVDAIHPGYGFLSENAAFAQKLNEAGLVFIGPDPQAIKIMGDKLAAKAAISKFDVPMLPGTDQAIQDLAEAEQIAEDIGFPVLIKAAAGGGGKGMRLVQKKSELREQLARASSEAKSAFGDGSVFIEKYADSPRHIEIQILADHHGNIVHLFERECSIQRRHQKVIEEAPSAVLTPSLRERMGKAAIDAARSCQYRGAGTVEFLLDKDMNFYFLEMNTRLQVEHPVTEMITGIDLVEQQIKIAQNEPLAFQQSDITRAGHAIELRVYAEDPNQNFAPSIGQLTQYQEPTMNGVRVDSGYRQDMEVPIYYDPMLSKLIVHASDRRNAIKLMLDAIEQYKIRGVETTLSFGEFVMRHPKFVDADFDTHFVENYFTGKHETDISEKEMLAAALVAKFYRDEDQKILRSPKIHDDLWSKRH